MDVRAVGKGYGRRLIYPPPRCNQVGGRKNHRRALYGLVSMAGYPLRLMLPSLKFIAKRCTNSTYSSHRSCNTAVMLSIISCLYSRSSPNNFVTFPSGASLQYAVKDAPLDNPYFSQMGIPILSMVNISKLFVLKSSTYPPRLKSFRNAERSTEVILYTTSFRILQRQ